jgi:hypothetical protein
MLGSGAIYKTRNTHCVASLRSCSHQRDAGWYMGVPSYQSRFYVWL